MASASFCASEQILAQGHFLSILASRQYFSLPPPKPRLIRDIRLGTAMVLLLSSMREASSHLCCINLHGSRFISFIGSPKTENKCRAKKVQLMTSWPLFCNFLPPGTLNRAVGLMKLPSSLYPDGFEHPKVGKQSPWYPSPQSGVLARLKWHISFAQPSVRINWQWDTYPEFLTKVELDFCFSYTTNLPDFFLKPKINQKQFRKRAIYL